MRTYDAKHNRLVYEGDPSSAAFWDRHWHATRDIPHLLRTARADPAIVATTRRYLMPSPTVRLLDGGCGAGQLVARFARLGYDAYGVETASETVKRINILFPQLKIRLGDVRHLPYPDGFFDGYWSIGVIEHWYDGYQAAAAEMRRVIKRGGYLFLTFPHMSPLRQFKARRRYYRLFNPATFARARFYQFALDAKAVTATFAALGFTCIQQSGIDGVKGAKDEIAWLQPSLKRLYQSQQLAARLMKVGLSFLLAPWAGHSALLVLQKDGPSRQPASPRTTP